MKAGVPITMATHGNEYSWDINLTPHQGYSCVASMIITNMVELCLRLILLSVHSPSWICQLEDTVTFLIDLLWGKKCNKGWTGGSAHFMLLQRSWVRIPWPTWWLTTITVTPVSRVQCPFVAPVTEAQCLFQLLWASAHIWHAHTYSVARKYTHKKINIF